MKVLLLSIGMTGAFAQPATAPINLPEVTVYSPHVANQTPAGAFAMPVSALRYDPLIDLQARNLGEGQADITVRGGIFENTGFQLGAISLGDPQTGHYFAEIPVAPIMLTAPNVRTGAALAQSALNATSGAIAYDWRPIRNGGAAALGSGEHAFVRSEFYQGLTTLPRANGRRFAVDVAAAHSESDGAVNFGEHRFDRVNGRIQTTTDATQTDLFAGYQAKFFGWPNLYTPFNSNETEDLETTLFALNHRVALGGGDFISAGAYHRRNKDDYAFNRFAPVGAVHPFQHTTWMTGAAVDGHRNFGSLAVNVRGEVVADELESTSLTFGRFRTRSFRRISIIPEKTWAAADGGHMTVKAGASYDDTNRDAAALSPMVEVARTWRNAALRRIYASYAESTQLPTYTALNSNPAAGLFRGNPALGRQSTRNLEAGIAGEIGGWTTSAALFRREDDALVDWTFRQGVIARTANAVDITVTGAELVARRSCRAADVVIGYTGLTKDADYRGAAVDASFYALNYARHRLTAAFKVRLGHGFEFRCDNVARIQADNLLRVVGGDESVMTSVGLSFRPRIWPRAEVALHVDNLWDSDFQEVPAVPASPRQISMGVAYTW